MERRILDLSGEGAHLKKARGSLSVLSGRNGRNPREILVPFDDIEAVIVHAREVSYTSDALLALCDAGAPLVLCDQAHRPKAWLWPAENNFEQARRMQAQLECGKPLKKSLWADLVRSKIEQQGALVATLGLRDGAFKDMARRVRSGDPDNMEATAAVRYWPMVMGPGFRRDHRLPGVNTLLNYGYTVLRAAVSRYLMGAGLHPSLGLHHHNRFNAFCLSDDVMEPFRPQVDSAVISLLRAGIEEVTPEAKTELVAVLSRQMEMEAGFVPLSRCVERLTTSLAQSLLERSAALDLPKSATFFQFERGHGTAAL